MAIETESRRVVVIEADDRDVKRAEQAMARRQAALAKKQDEHLAQFLKAQGNLTKETLTTARAAQALIDKEKEAAKAVDLIGLSMDGVKKKTGAVGQGVDELRRKFGQVGKQLGGMLAGFGIGMAVGAATGLVEKLFAPPSPEQMDKFINSLRDSEGLMGNIARQAAVYRAHMEAAAKQDAALEAKFKAADALELKYSAAARERALTGELKALDAARLTPDEEARARSDIFEKYRKLADEAEGAAKETRELKTAVRAARREVAGFGSFRGPWEGQPDLAADIAAQDAASRPQFLAQGRADLLRSGRFGGDPGGRSRGDEPTWIERTIGKQSDFDLAVASFNAVSSAATSAYDALVEGQLSASKAAALFIRSVVKGLGQQFLVEGLGESARSIARLAVGDFAGAAKHGKSAAAFFAGAAVAGAIAHGMGGGGGAGGGGATASSAGGSGGSGRSGGGEDTNTLVVVLSNSFIGADDETQRRAAERMVQAGTKRNRAVRMG